MSVASAPAPTSVGIDFAKAFHDAIREVDAAPVEGSRNLPVLHGVHLPPKAAFTRPQDNVLLDAIKILNDSQRYYAFGSSIVVDRDGDGGRRLLPLSTGMTVETCVEGVLANHMRCQVGETEFPAPRWFGRQLMLCELLPPRLPRIRQYAARPLFDRDYNLRPAGWHPDTGMLIHGPHVEPYLHSGFDAGLRPLDRLPPLLRSLLGGFCLASPADVANALGALLTGVLANHFIDSPKAIFLIDGTQPGLGKTLLVRVIGLVLDGLEAPVVSYTPDDEELQKRLCAQFRRGESSVVLIDNAKTAGGAPVSSPVIESQSMAPEVSFRILGQSEMLKRPNTYVWAITMNSTKVSPDLMSRGVPVRLAYEGKPEDRRFAGPEPVKFARENRVALLSELAGMVVRWNQAGRPAGTASHRCGEWAGVIGGVLAEAGFPEFLANYGEAAARFDTRLEALAALAEAVVEAGGPFVEVKTFSE